MFRHPNFRNFVLDSIDDAHTTKKNKPSSYKTFQVERGSSRRASSAFAPAHLGAKATLARLGTPKTSFALASSTQSDPTVEEQGEVSRLFCPIVYTR